MESKDLLKNEMIKGYLEKFPTTRHEAWFSLTCFTNIEILKELKKLNKLLSKKEEEKLEAPKNRILREDQQPNKRRKKRKK